MLVEIRTKKGFHCIHASQVSFYSKSEHQDIQKYAKEHGLNEIPEDTTAFAVITAGDKRAIEFFSDEQEFIYIKDLNTSYTGS